MEIPINSIGKHSPDVGEAEIFSKWKKAFPRIGSTHREMLMEFIIKIRLKVIFRQIYDLRCKKERKKERKKDQSWSDLRKGEL